VTIWHLILIASILSFALKFSGYLVPASLLERPVPARIANLMTVALLAALISVQTLAGGQAIAIDARIPAVIIAGVLFALRVPFIVVIIVAAAVAAVIRLLT
jgi:hypothetical protein